MKKISITTGRKTKNESNDKLTMETEKSNKLKGEENATENGAAAEGIETKTAME